MEMEPDRIETLGKQYYTLTGQYLEYEKYLYLMKHQGSLPDLLRLLSPEVLIEAEHLRAEFREHYYATGLLMGEMIMPKDTNVMAEKLPRYIVIPEHSHDFIEFACVLSGSCRHIVEGQEYLQEAGSIVYIISKAKHQLIAVEDAFCITIKVKREFFMDLNLPFVLDFITPVLYRCGDDPAFSSLVIGLLNQSSDRLYRSQIRELLFEALMLYIGQNYRDTRQRLYHGPLLNQRIVPILDYMVANYRTVTLRSIAEHFHYSETYLSRLFHEQAGETFSARLRDFKLDQAAQLLRETTKKLDAVCEEVGYTDVTQFIHNFKKKYGVTPMQYRKSLSRKA